MYLQLVAAFALFAPAAFAAPQVDDPARLLPADTLVYFGTHSFQAGASAANGGAMRLILDEPEVKAFLAKPVTAADKVLKELLTQGGIAAEEGQRFSVDGMMSGREGGVQMGKVFLAMTHFGLPTPGAAGANAPPMPDIGLVVGLELLDARDVALLKALWGRIEWPEEQGSYKGQDFVLKTSPEGAAIRLAFVGNLAIATLSEKSLHAVLDRSGAPGADSLAKAADYSQLVGTVGGLKPGASTWIIRVAPMANLVSGVLGMAMLSGGDDPEQAEHLAMVSAVVQGLGLDGVRWVGGADWREPTGRVKGTAIVSITPGAQGLLPRCMAETGSIDRQIVEGVPGDSLSMSAGSIDWLPAVYDFAMSTFKAIEPTEYEGVQAQIQQFMGESDLREDILVNLHGTMLSYSLPGSGFPEQPSQIMRVGVRDPEAFITALRTLATSVATTFLDSPDAVTLNESDHEGRTLYELDLSKTPAAMGMMQPAFAVDGDELVMCLQSTKALKTALNGTPVESSLAQNKNLSGFIDSLTGKGKLTSLSFTDNAKSFGALYGGVASAAQMFGGAAGDLPLDLSLMPSEQAITKHLAQSWTGGYVTSDGATFVSHSDGQFQLSDFVPLLMTTGIVGFSLAADMGGGDEEPIDEDPYAVVQRHLGEISAGMTVFKISEGRFPDSINDLVRPLADYPEGCLGKSEAPVDPWGHAYNFRLNERKKPFLWSSGPDGVDQGGEGDDIVKG
jgi:hypothetical protein